MTPGRIARFSRAVLSLFAVVGMLALPAAAARWDSLATTVFRNYGREQGLPHPALTALAQDRQGFIWIGTQGGLARWDGYRFRSYRAKPGDAGSLPDDYIQTLHVDAAGRLWVGTGGGGLALYDGARDRFVGVRLGLAKDRVNIGAIADDGRGGLWVSWQEGLLHLDPATGKAVPVRGAPRGRIKAMLRDRAGTLWVGTKAMLARRDAGARGFVAVRIGAGVDQVSALFEDGKGRIWIGTEQHGLFAIDRPGAAARPVGGAGSAMPGSVSAIAAAGKDEIWAGLRGGGGLLSVNGASGAVRIIRRDRTLANSLADNDIWALLRDRAGSMWVGTGGGLSYTPANAGPFVTLFGGGERPGGLSSTDILAILPARDGHVWVGYLDGGADRIDPEAGQVQRFAPGPGGAEGTLPADLLFAMTEGGDGTIYFGTRRGLYARGPGAASVRLVGIPGRPPRISTAELAFGDGILWVGGEEDGLWGVEVASGRVVFGPKQSAGLADQGIRMIRRGPGPYLWIGSRNGLDRIHLASGRIDHIGAGPVGSAAPPGRNINSLALDRKGRLWVGSFGGGLTMIADWAGKRPRLRHFGMAEGLPHANVDSVQIDGDGVIWVSTDDGLARVDPESLAIRPAGHADGAFLVDYLAGGGASTAQGEALFGASGGLTVVRPGSLPSWTHRPAIVVTDIRIGERPVAVGPFNQSGAAQIVELTPETNSLAVEFAALDFTSPERNRYAYRLDGYDSHWIETEASRRLAIYTNLPPGDYALRLRGTNRAGLWSAQDRVLSVRVLPAWYQRLWVRLAAAVLAVLAIAGLVRWRTAYLRRRQRELEAEIAGRTADLRAANERLGLLATTDPLTGLANRWHFMEQARELIAASAEAGEALSLVVLDIDRFKQVNDQNGHPVGDAVLTRIGGILAGLGRPADLIGRIGGEEFALLMPGVSAPVARDLAERLREAIGESAIGLDETSVRVTASIGVTELHPGEAFDTLYARADTALYAAKHAGRNRVETVD